MALVIADKVKVRSFSTGTGAITLETVFPGFQSFSTVGDGNETYYGIEDAAGNWEVGSGTYSVVGSVETLSRDTVYSSSNANSLVDFPAGGKTVFCTFPANLVNTIISGSGLDLSSVSQNIVPSIDSDGITGYSLGSPTYKWKELFVSTGSIYIGDVKLSNVAGKIAATKVLNPGTEYEEPDTEDEDAFSNIGGGGTTLPSDSTGYLYNDGSGNLAWASGGSASTGDITITNTTLTGPVGIGDYIIVTEDYQGNTNGFGGNGFYAPNNPDTQQLEAGWIVHSANGSSEVITSVSYDAGRDSIVFAFDNNVAMTLPLTITAADYTPSNIIIQPDELNSVAQWTFKGDGTLVFPDGTEQTTAAATSNPFNQTLDTTSDVAFNTSTIVNGSNSAVITEPGQISVLYTGDLTYALSAGPGGGSIITESGKLFQITTNGAGPNGKDWLFDTDGSLYFPDGTQQTTAYTGQASGAVFGLDIDGGSASTSATELIIDGGGA